MTLPLPLYSEYILVNFFYILKKLSHQDSLALLLGTRKTGTVLLYYYMVGSLSTIFVNDVVE
jgi:hypothetical protein